MQYRSFGKLDWQVSALGFGGMRFPTLDKNPANIDEKATIKMIRRAIDGGVNYIDTAQFYHGGMSEVVIGKALKDGYRDKVKICTKLPTFFVRKPEDYEFYLNQQLDRFQLDEFDFYFIQGLNKHSWQIAQKFNLLERAENAMKAGKFGYLGFSFHDDLETFKTIIDGTDLWTSCLIQYNYMDTEYQAGTEGLKYASGKGIAVAVMEPLRGGALAKEPPKSVAEVFERAHIKRSPAEWAFLWLWNQPEVAVALSGMDCMAHVEENLEYADHAAPNSFSDEDHAFIEKIKEKYQEISPIQCTACRYCMPCPNGVNIPKIFSLYNDGYNYENHRASRMFYRQMIPTNEQADQCVDCGECMEKCPQHLPIPEWLEKVHGWLGPKK